MPLVFMYLIAATAGMLHTVSFFPKHLPHQSSLLGQSHKSGLKGIVELRHMVGSPSVYNCITLDSSMMDASLMLSIGF